MVRIQPVNLKKIYAFTIAEVIIVLGIIGIIAEMTIPTLMNNVNDQAKALALKKEMSVIQQALTTAWAEEGPIDGWFTFPEGVPISDWSEAGAAVGNILAKYLKVNQNCGTNTTGCFAPSYASLSSARLVRGQPSTSISIPSQCSKMLLADGSSLGASVSTNGSDIWEIMFYVDVNGLKGPNRAGEDLFQFYALSKLAASVRGALPSFYANKPGIVYPQGELSSYPSPALNSTCSAISTGIAGTGLNCTAWVVYQGNLDYKYVDDLNWNSKYHR